MHYSQLSFFLPLLAGSVEAGKMVAPRSRGADRHDMPLKWSPFGFLSSIKVGTPQLEIPVFVDWTWISQFILSPKCYGHQDPSACLNADQLYFDQAKSSSYKDKSKQYPSRTWLPNHFFFWQPLTVDYALESLQVGPVKGDIVVQLSNTEFDLSAFPYPFTGVFGLSPVFQGDNASYQSPFYQQWAKGLWKKPTMGFAYCYEENKKSACNGADGVQSLGGIRNDLIKDNKIYWYENKLYPDVNTLAFEYTPGIFNYWATELTKLTIGGEAQPIERTSADSGKGAIFDHASYGKGAPLTENAYAKLVHLTGAWALNLTDPTVVNNGNQTKYAVDCNSTSTLPTIGYTFEGQDKEWVLSGKQYVQVLKDGTCALDVRVLADGDRFIGTFGETFAKTAYVIMDFEKLKVGLADYKWPSACKP